MSLDVDALPARAAHAIHALMAASDIAYGNGIGPFTAAEVCVYDAGYEAITSSHTGAALREAAKLGLCAYIPPGYWTPTNLARDHKRAFEERFLRDEEEAGY